MANLPMDEAFSDEEMRRMAGVPDLVYMPMGEPKGHVPEGYLIDPGAEVDRVLFKSSDQPFEVWCRPFLDGLEEYGTILRACKEAGISRREYRMAMQYQSGFAEAVQDSRDTYADKIEGKILDELQIDSEIPMDPKAYALAYRVLQAHAPERFGGSKGRETKAMTDEQKRFLIAQLVQQGVTPQEALAIIDSAGNAIKIAASNP